MYLFVYSYYRLCILILMTDDYTVVSDNVLYCASDSLRTTDFVEDQRSGALLVSRFETTR